MRNIKLKSRKNKVAAYVATTFFVVAAIAVTVNVGFLTSTLNLSNNEVLLGALTILFSFTTTVFSMMYLKRRNDFEKIFDVVASIFPDAILVSDDKDKVVLANEAAGKLLNRNIEDVYGASLDELFEEKAGRLIDYPGLGRPGRVTGTRELVAHQNYILIYDVTGDLVRMLRVLHATEQWPSQDQS